MTRRPTRFAALTTGALLSLLPAAPARADDVSLDQRGAGAQLWVAADDGEVLRDGERVAALPRGAGDPPVVAIDVVRTQDGFWLAASDGGVFTFGGAGFFGSLGGTTLNAPIVDFESTPSGGRYWLVAADGGVFTFGDAPFLGSLGGQPLQGRVTGCAANDDGSGYWLTAEDGGVFSFGTPFLGSMAGRPLNGPVNEITNDPGPGAGYWLVAADGGVFSFGEAGFLGTSPRVSRNGPVTDLAPTEDGKSYYLLGSVREAGVPVVVLFPRPEEGSSPTLTVTPSPAPPGTALTITGGGCPGGGAIVHLAEDGHIFEGGGVGRSDVDGRWTTTLTAPSAREPGARFTAGGGCYVDGYLAFVYPDAPFDLE